VSGKGMSARIQQAVGQVRLTNVAVVRLKRGGKKFEIACYKNKVVNWRSGVETDLSEVLQADGVYENVTRGNLAKKKDLLAAFDTTDTEKVCLNILKHGKLQVSSKERQVEIETMFKDIARIVAEKCINTHTKRPFTVSTIERAMKDTLHYAVKQSKNTKQQALAVIQMLKEHLPIERAHMKIQFTLPSKLLKPLKKGMEKYNLVYVKEDFMGANCTVTCNIQPGAYRSLDETLKKLNKYNNLYISEIDVLSMATTIDDNHNNNNTNNNGTSSDTLTDGFVHLNVNDDEVNTLTFPSKGKSDFSDVIESYNNDVKNNNIDTFTDNTNDAVNNDGLEQSIIDTSNNDYSINNNKKKKKKKKKGKRRNKNMEDQMMDDMINNEQSQLKKEVEADVIDLCGYTYESHRGGWLLRPPSEADIAITVTTSLDGTRNTIDPAEELKRIRRNEKNSWKIFGEKEKPGLWNQKLQGWLIQKKYDERLELLGAIKL
jgi:ribosome maturation protein SDO1